MTIGLVLADYVFILLAIFGLSFVAQLMGEAFVIIKYLCAAYLIWMGCSLLMNNDSMTLSEAPQESKGSAILLGFLLTLGNPKAIIFYVALFPAFVDIAAIRVVDILGVMACATLAFGSSNLVYAWLSAQARRLITTSKRMTMIRRFAGTVMTASGLGVALRS